MTVEFFATSQRDVVVDEIADLDTANPGCGASVAVAIERLEAGENVKRLPGTSLWEVKTDHNGKTYRVLYALVKLKNQRTVVVVLTVFQKNTQKTPAATLKKAEKRLRAFRDQN